MAIKEIVSRIIAGMFSIFALSVFMFCAGVILKILIFCFKWGYRIVL